MSCDFYVVTMMLICCAGAPRVSSHFHQEFPSLQAAGEGEKGDGQEEEPYGPGPSLRPQSTVPHKYQEHEFSHHCYPGVQESVNKSYP